MLLWMFESTIAAELAELRQQGVRLHFFGDLARLPPSLQQQLAAAQAATEACTALHLAVCLSYGAVQDLAAAARAIAESVEAGQLAAQDITPALLARHLGTAVLGAYQNPDLIIRTGGEQRLSNFLLMEAAYSELYFTGPDVLWPDFCADHLAAALQQFAERQRRFGQRVASSAP